MSLDIKFLNDIKAESSEFILENFLPIPRNAVTLLSASGGTGKTRLALIMASKHIINTGEVVALWLTEDYPGQVRHIFDEMVDAGLASALAYEKMALILDAPPQLAKREHGIFKANYSEIADIGKSLVQRGTTMCVFDPLLAFYGGQENDNSEARVFIQAFAEWAKVSQITTLIIHHANKDGFSRGASAFHDGVRARYEMHAPRNADGEVDTESYSKGIRTVTLMKDNWGVRKPLWRMTGGSDEINLKIAPMMIPETHEYRTSEMEVV